MQAEYYTDKSIAVFGETKPWANDLRNLGGKFNANLKGRPGWIFQRSKEAELMQFIINANGGLIQPSQSTTSSYQPSMVPQTFMQPALSPQAAMSRLSLAQPPARINIPQPAVGTIPDILLPPKPISPGIPKPFVPLQQQPTQLSYPNLFTGGDGLTYQVLIYTVPYPQINQNATLSVGDSSVEYTVTDISKTSSPYDSILITRTDTLGSEEPAVSQAVIVNGKWRINGMQADHNITFHPSK